MQMRTTILWFLMALMMVVFGLYSSPALPAERTASDAKESAALWHFLITEPDKTKKEKEEIFPGNKIRRALKELKKARQKSPLEDLCLPNSRVRRCP
jgi:hypothetical protein